MRLRNIPGSREAIAASEYVVHEDIMREKRGCWNEVFENDHLLFLEVGMGKGTTRESAFHLLQSGILPEQIIGK